MQQVPICLSCCLVNQEKQLFSRLGQDGAKTRVLKLKFNREVCVHY